MRTSNTPECFRSTIGKQIVGCLFNALPLGDRGLAAGNKTLVFSDGTGLTVSNNGSYWTESEDDIVRAVARKKAELDHIKEEITGVLQVAGALEEGTVA